MHAFFKEGADGVAVNEYTDWYDIQIVKYGIA